MCYCVGVLIFENRATDGCGTCGLNLKGEMSAAVEHERFILTANTLRTDTIRLNRRASKEGRFAPGKGERV